MDKFDIYEFCALLLPGSVVVYGLGLLYPNLGVIAQGNNFTVGTLGLFTVLSYIAGGLIQAGGNLVSFLWRKISGGVPSDWVRQGKRNILSKDQTAKLIKKISEILDLNIDLEKVSQKDWTNVTRQLYIAVRQNKDTSRIDMFLAQCNLYRGLAASLIVIAIFTYARLGNSSLWIVGLIVLSVGTAIYRMHRFSKYYAKELFMQFLQLKNK